MKVEEFVARLESCEHPYTGGPCCSTDIVWCNICGAQLINEIWCHPHRRDMFRGELFAELDAAVQTNLVKLAATATSSGDGPTAPGCSWGPPNPCSYRRCARSGESSFDPKDSDNCGAPECQSAIR